MTDNPRALIMFVVYDHPLDYPDSFVVRRVVVTPEHGDVYDPEPWAVAGTLEEVRLAIDPRYWVRYTRLPPEPEDDPVIAEVWL